MNTTHGMNITMAIRNWTGLALLTTPLSAAKPTEKSLVPSEEFVGTSAGWKNLTTDFGAVAYKKTGDEVTETCRLSLEDRCRVRV